MMADQAWSGSKDERPTPYLQLSTVVPEHPIVRDRQTLAQQPNTGLALVRLVLLICRAKITFQYSPYGDVVETSKFEAEGL